MKEFFSRILHKHFPDTIHKCFPGFWYFLLYRRATRKLGDKAVERKNLFRELIEGSENKNCLQIGVRNRKYAPHWISVDLYDQSDYIDYHYDVRDMKFEDESFDIVVCNAILEHVEEPVRAIKELRRILRKDGLLWVEAPFNQPYHPSPADYWRVSLEGVRVWMRDFTEIAAGLFTIDGSPIYNGVFFYGRK